MNEFMEKIVEEEKKFKTEEVTMQNGSKMLRIIALRPIETSRGVVKPGEPGGLIAHEDCLSQSGDCWVWYNAKVLNNARVRDNAQVFGNAVITDDAKIYDQVEISGDAVVMEDALVGGGARIYDSARVCGSSRVCGYAKVYDYAIIANNATVSNHATIRGSAKVSGNSNIHGHAIIEGNSNISGNVEIFENAIISVNDGEHNEIMMGRFGINAYIDGKATDYIVAGPLGSRDDMITVYYTKNGLYVCCGCFKGSVDDFSHAVLLTHGKNNKHSHFHDYNSFILFAISILNRHHAEAWNDKPKDINNDTLYNTRSNNDCDCECATMEAE